MQWSNRYILSFLMIILLASCGGNQTQDQIMEPRTPVTVTTISNGVMQEYIELNATSAFLQRWIVRANTTGYLQIANVALNKYVTTGELLYTIKTKEAQSLGNSIKILDSTFRFSGLNNVKANGSGFISQLNHQPGDYVQEGEQLAVITDTKSFVFLLNLPYELRPYIINKKSLDLLLPDGEKLTGNIFGNMPLVDSSSQTQSIILRVNASHPIPENLIAKVDLITSYKNNTSSLPKAAVLANETQTSFWIMKMINDSIAVKIPVKKGIEAGGKVEILSPVFSASDKILVTGNYGLEDTAKVQVMQQTNTP